MICLDGVYVLCFGVALRLLFLGVFVISEWFIEVVLTVNSVPSLLSLLWLGPRFIRLGVVDDVHMVTDLLLFSLTFGWHEMDLGGIAPAKLKDSFEVVTCEGGCDGPLEAYWIRHESLDDFEKSLEETVESSNVVDKVVAQARSNCGWHLSLFCLSSRWTFSSPLNPTPAVPPEASLSLDATLWSFSESCCCLRCRRRLDASMAKRVLAGFILDVDVEIRMRRIDRLCGISIIEKVYVHTLVDGAENIIADTKRNPYT